MTYSIAILYGCIDDMHYSNSCHYGDSSLQQGEMMLRSAEKATDQRWPPEEPKDEILEDAVEEP